MATNPKKTTHSEAGDNRQYAEPTPVAYVDQPEPREEALRPVRFLWPNLMSLWQAGER